MQVPAGCPYGQRACFCLLYYPLHKDHLLQVIKKVNSQERFKSILLSKLQSIIEDIVSKFSNHLPGARAVRSISWWMKAAPAGAMDVGDMIMGPGKAGGLPMGAACSTGWAWKTKMDHSFVIELKINDDAVKLKMEQLQQHPVPLVFTSAPRLKKKRSTERHEYEQIFFFL